MEINYAWNKWHVPHTNWQTWHKQNRLRMDNRQNQMANMRPKNAWILSGVIQAVHDMFSIFFKARHWTFWWTRTIISWSVLFLGALAISAQRTKIRSYYLLVAHSIGNCAAKLMNLETAAIQYIQYEQFSQKNSHDRLTIRGYPQHNSNMGASIQKGKIKYRESNPQCLFLYYYTSYKIRRKAFFEWKNFTD
jgi:hypothetical protein